MNDNKNLDIVAPLYITLERKTKKDKNISLNMNWYRNCYHFENNTVKKKFRDFVSEQIEGRVIETPIKPHYKLYWKRMSDLDNWQAVVTKYLQDALVEAGVIPDDNFKYIVGNDYDVIEQDKDNPRFEITIKSI